MRLLVVEDDADLRRQLADTLSHAGYAVDLAADGEDGQFLGETEPYDAVILDLGLPKIDGVSVLKSWRKEGKGFPVLILTARDQWSEKVSGFDAGADDYLSKPFAMEELLARIRALQRRQPSYRAPLLEVGSFRLDLGTGQLLVATAAAEVCIELSTKEQQLMSYFLEHPGEVISGSRLRNQLWNLQQDPISNVVAAQVRLLRRKLASHGLASPIETVPSQGYRLNPQAALLL